MTWTAHEIRQLRYRLGWSQAEMARCLQLEASKIMAWELGREPLVLAEDQRSALLRILHQAESNSERVQRRPIAEVIMKDRGLCQIHDFEVVSDLEDRIFNGDFKGHA